LKKQSVLHGRFCSRIFGFALFAVLAVALSAVAVRTHAQEATSAEHATAGHEGVANPEKSEGAEGSKAEESHEEAFLNAPVIFKIADFLHMKEPVVRDLLLLINFAIIFFAIVIPLAKVMPKVFRKRAQNLSHELDVARQASEEARKRMSAVEAKLAGLDREIASFRAQVEQESLEDEKRIKASIQEESARIVASAEQEISVAAQHARRTLQNFAADLAIESAAKQLKLTPETDRALINEFIGQIADGEAGNGSSAGAGRGGAK
jgi:F-type H+-transporting ATPase subunit b